MGGFVASFGNVDVTIDDEEGGAIYPVIGDQPACDEAPQLMANLLGTAEVTEHVAFYKDLPAPDGLTDAAGVDTVRINIVADEIEEGDVDIDNLELRLSALHAGELNIDAGNASEDEDIDISEFNDFTDNSDPDESYGNEDDEVQSLTADDLSENVEFGIGIPEDAEVEIDDGLAAAHQVSFESITLPNVDLFVTMIDEDQDDFDVTGVEDRSVDIRDCDELADESSPDTYEDDGDPAYPSL